MEHLNGPDRVRPGVGIALVLVIPLVTLYWLVTPLSGLTLGNDYPVYSIQQQLEVAYSLHYGSFPVYAPGLAGGRSAAALTLAQSWHPITHIARLVPGYWDGHALTIDTFLRLGSLGLCHLLAYVVLRRLGLGAVPALLVSFVTVYNLRMLDNFRYGPAVDNHVGYLLLSLALINRYLQPKGLGSAAAIVAGAFLLAVGGHPQIGYLGFLGAAIVAVAVPFVLGAFGGHFQRPWADRLRYWAGCLGLVAAGVVVAAPYVLPLYVEFLKDNAVRVGNDYQWSLLLSDTFGGALRSLFAPLEGDVHGAFGGSSLIALPALLPLLYLFRQRVPLVILGLLAACVLIFLVSLGDATPLHHLFWAGVPFASSFRVPGRIGMALLVPAMLMLAWLFRSSEAQAEAGGVRTTLSPLSAAALAGIAWLLVANFWLDGQLPASGPFTPGIINPRPGWVSPTLLALGLASLAAAFVYGLRATSRTMAWRGLTGVLLCVAVAGQVGLSLRYGTWVQPAKPQKTLAEMDADKRQDFRLVALPGAGMESVAVVEQMERSILEPRLARFYRKVIPVGDVEAAWSVLGSTRRPDEAVVVGLAANDLLPASAAVRAADEIQLVRGTFNEIDLVVTAQAPGLLAFNYPYTERLRALVNGAPVPVYRANGNESAVRLPAGRHAVALRYASPATTAGVLISAATLAAMGLLAAMLGLQGRARVPAAAAALLLPAAASVWWYQSLYAGAPMPADYYWTSTYLPNVENLAYGKRARASSTIDDQFPYYYYAGRAVDGRNDEMGFLTAIGEPNPWWEVDLGADHLISRIQLHDMGLVSKHFPLGIWLSADGQNFQRAAILDSPQQAGVWVVPIDNLPARFVRVQSPRNGPLGVAEIQVFGAPAP